MMAITVTRAVSMTPTSTHKPFPIPVTRHKMRPASRHHGRRSAAFAMTMFAWLAGCSPTQSDNIAPTTVPAKVGYQMPAGIHYVDHWVSTPAIDLMSPDGTFIRAFAEADDVRIFNIDGKKGSYPGFVG